ncbi:hypothetical protein V6N12_063523 [Hibiscus sabdariffa]|uniref:Histidine-containing phosphotransfer protein n=1 Tax=Hibiscus sabdariffa TaxID=183260 RepID=A0ABR2FC25_9ROSI
MEQIEKHDYLQAHQKQPISQLVRSRKETEQEKMVKAETDEQHNEHQYEQNELEAEPGERGRKKPQTLACFSCQIPLKTCAEDSTIPVAKTGLPVWMLGLAADRLRADTNRLLAFLFHQGILDEQFLQLQQLEDETSPNFVSEVVNIYFHESEKLLRNLRSLLMDREFSDYNKMGIHLNQFMGSSSSIGAKRIRNVCVAFRAASEQNNRAGCLRALELLEHEYCFLKNKLHELFQIQQQRALAAGVRYPMQN